MIRKLGFAFTLLGASLAIGAVAQTSDGLSEQYTACQARAGSNTVQSGICAQRELTQQDARLNKAYQQVMQQLAKYPAAKITLRDEERSWLKQRDYECKVDSDTINNTCLVAKTAARANQLESRVHF